MVDPIVIKIIAEVEFTEIVKSTIFLEFKLRIILIDDSFIDVNISQKINDKFSFHWDLQDEESTIYRYDNYPDASWQNVETYPYHFHYEKQNNLISSPFPKEISKGFRAFMEFVWDKISN